MSCIKTSTYFTKGLHKKEESLTKHDSYMGPVQYKRLENTRVGDDLIFLLQSREFELDLEQQQAKRIKKDNDHRKKTRFVFQNIFMSFSPKAIKGNDCSTKLSLDILIIPVYSFSRNSSTKVTLK